MSSKAKTLALRLLRENRKTSTKPGRSWRVIAREDYGGRVNHATLNRFANSRGEWIPKDENIQIALGLKTPRKPRNEKAFTPISEMATSHLRAALINRKEMPPVDPRILREFRKLGWIGRTRTR